MRISERTPDWVASLPSNWVDIPPEWGAADMVDITHPTGDQVSLSIEAKAIVAGGTPPPQENVWKSEAVTKGLAALNDTTGTTAVADQIAAYKLIHELVGSSWAFASVEQRAAAASVTAAFTKSPYAQHLQGVFANVNEHLRKTEHLQWTPGSLQEALDAFDALSADDQQTYVGARNAQIGWNALASVESYRANQTAMIGVMRKQSNLYADVAGLIPPNHVMGGLYNGDERSYRIDAVANLARRAEDRETLLFLSLADMVVSDRWTAEAEAHFAKYGPPPETSPPDEPLLPRETAAPGYTPPTGDQIAGALIALNDDSGKTEMADRLAARDMLYAYMMKGGEWGPGLTAISKNLAWAEAHLGETTQVAPPPGVDPAKPSDPAPAKATRNRLASLPDEDVEPEFRRGGGSTGGFASLDSFEANIAAGRAAGDILDAVLEKYRANRLENIRDLALTGTDRFKSLAALFADPDTENDSWTRKAEAVVAQWADSIARP